MKDTVQKQLEEALSEKESSGADGDRSEQPASLFSNLDSDDGESYNKEADQTPELDKIRVSDK